VTTGTDPDAWRADAECLNHPTKWWFPEPGQRPERAIAICNECPVKAQCAEAGKDEPHGVWGGIYRCRGRIHYVPSERVTDTDRLLDAFGDTPKSWLTRGVLTERTGIGADNLGIYLARLKDRGLVEHDARAGRWRAKQEVGV